MSERKSNKLAGWAAYNRKQQQNKDLKEEFGNEPYPPISSTVIPLHVPGLVKKNEYETRSFSSVSLPSTNLSTLVGSKPSEKPLMIGSSSTNWKNKVLNGKQGSNVNQAYEELKGLHPWADKSLIKDILEAVNNDVVKASNLLKEMVSSDFPEENKEKNHSYLEYSSNNIHMENNTFLAENDFSSRDTEYLVRLSCEAEDEFTYKGERMINEHAASGNTHSDYSAPQVQILGSLMYVPVEPEWEEDDIYIVHRKEAMRMMRSASQHSKVASDAYLRGDHSSAQQFSQKAREEWKAAKELNAMAAKEILSIRNCKNDLWTLDLHGLHSAEAVQALQDHLQKIELQVPYFSSSSRVDITADMMRSVSLQSLHIDTEKLGKLQPSYRPRSMLLEVITGKGNHSRGQAALPIAIENFLSENGYHYDKCRPGVITVRPKFRHH